MTPELERLIADPFVVLFCALFASVCGTWAAAKLAGSNVDDGGKDAPSRPYDPDSSGEGPSLT